MRTTLSRRAFLQLCLASLAAGLLPGCRSKPSPPAPTSTPSPTDTPSPTSAATPSAPARTPVTLSGTETWTISSKIVSQDYQVFINFPGSYGQGNRFPALYVMDGNGAFPLVRGIYGELKNENKIPETLIVGVGYPTTDAKLIGGLRARDLTPFPDASATIYQYPPQDYPYGTGGGSQFLRFIREELKPAIDARYTTFPDQATLLGHSFGGLFTLYALFQQPSIFNRFIAGSPSIWWASGAILRTEKDYAAAHTDLAARLFMGSGTDEGTEGADVTSLADTLRQRKYPSLQVTTKIFDGQAHVSVIPFIMSQGLREVNR